MWLRTNESTAETPQGKLVELGQLSVEVLLDAFIVEYFEAQAGEQGYQALMNQALAEYIHHRSQ